MIHDEQPANKYLAAPDRKRDVLRALLEQIDLAESMRRRAVHEAITQALPQYWRRRSQDFRAAAPKPGDYIGRASLTELAEQGLRCLEASANCARHAQLLEADGLPPAIAEEIADALDEVA